MKRVSQSSETKKHCPWDKMKLFATLTSDWATTCGVAKIVQVVEQVVELVLPAILAVVAVVLRKSRAVNLVRETELILLF